MVEGFSEHADGRHHGAHGGPAARALGITAESLLDFSANINPLGTPPEALRAAEEALFSGTPRYPDLRYPELREALAGYLGVPTGSVLPTNGGAEALFLAAAEAGNATGETLGKALILEPTFSEYAAAAAAAGLQVVRRLAWRPETDGFTLDYAALDDLSGVRLVFLGNPNNPTGSALSTAAVLELTDKVREAGATLVVDEAFADFAPEVSVAAEAHGPLVVARSFTKFFAMPGLRLGCLVHPELERFEARQPSWAVNVAAAAAGVAATGNDAYIKRSLEEIPNLREALVKGLSSLPGLTAYPAAANFVLVRGPEGVPEKLARRGVLVRGCGPFMGLGPEYFRVAVRGPEETTVLLEALREEL